MELRFLGKQTQGGGSPTLFATDRETYIVQGWRVPEETTSVEIPKGLLRFLEPDTQLGVPLQDTGRDSYILAGAAVLDHEVLMQMDIPGHETCVEVGKIREGDVGATADG